MAFIISNSTAMPLETYYHEIYRFSFSKLGAINDRRDSG
jgi:hypothetical protein